MTIVGRKYEQKQLERVLQSNEAEFVAVYGRRRVGKTYLIREFCQHKRCIFFRSSGVRDGSLSIQLAKFAEEMNTTFFNGGYTPAFESWHDAFSVLTGVITKLPQKVVIFLDELPWMATPKSDLLEALDYYWNRYWSENKYIKLIICGSAASWIIDNILHNTGGLHNRVTLRLPIEPFTLKETKEYLKYKNIRYNDEQILKLYMCLGGIPFYFKFLDKGLSAIQNINNLCFSRKGTLYDEFDMLFASLFNSHEVHEKIIRILAEKREGVSRADIEKQSDYKGGRLSKRLNELEEAGFVTKFTPWKKERGIFYKIIDEYSLFYLNWIVPKTANHATKSIDDAYWETLSQSAAWKAWSGYAFEAICFKHIDAIKKALNIPSGSEVSSWRYIPDASSNLSGAQIDLVFDRPDGIVNLCEIKYCKTPFAIDKKYAHLLLEREKTYKRVTKTTKQIFHSIIASSGLKKTLYSEEIIASVVKLNDLFE